jgi:zinc protease
LKETVSMSKSRNLGTTAAGLALAGLAAFVALPAQAAIAIQHWTLANGARVYLAATDALPIVDVQVDFDAGGRRDPPAQAGLASATARSSSAVALAAREIGEPSFPADIWQREREQIGAAIKEANTRPATVAARTFASRVYGSHPYGEETTEATLAAIDVATMRTRYESLIQPCRAKLSIVGAVTRAQADAIATRLLARLPAPAQAGCAALPPVAEVPALAAPVEENVPFESAQAHVLIGQPGYQRRDPDHFALTLGNYILGGGGFVSRLTNEVREKRGLAYSVYSGFSPGLHAGAFRVAFQTRPDQAAAAVKVSREVLAKFVAEGPTTAELKAAKDNVIGGFPLLLDSNAKLLGNVANIAWNDLPLDYLDTWTARMNAITVSDIRAAFARKLQPDRMVAVVVGGRP